MKKTKLFTFIGTSFCALSMAAGAIFSSPKEVTSTSASETPDTISLYINGIGVGDPLYDFTYTGTDDNDYNLYELKIYLQAGTQFMLSRNHSSESMIGHRTNVEQMNDHKNADILTIAGDWFKIKDGMSDYYIVTFRDRGSSSWAPDVGITSFVPIQYQITYHCPNDLTYDAELTESYVWTAPLHEVDGYYLEGWYTDSELTNKLQTNTKIVSDILPNAEVHLYGNYIASDDYFILVEESFFHILESNNPTMYLYLSRNHLDGAVNADFPGVSIMDCEKLGDYYMVEIDASKSYSALKISARADGVEQKYAHETNEYQLTLEPYKAYCVSLYDSAYNIYQNITIEFNAYSLVALLQDLGGDWENNDVTTANCANNYNAAKEMFLKLESTHQETFKTSGGDLFINAQNRYTRWCTANGDINPYGKAQFASNNLANISKNSFEYIASALVLIICAGLLITIVSKKRKSIQK